MINILINVWFPVEKGTEVYKKMLEIDKIIPFPPEIKPTIPWSTWAVKYGNKGAGRFETSEEFFDKAIDYFVRRLTMYEKSIDGYKFEIAAAVESEKGRTLIGKDVSDFLL